jgi:hypothetical protein
MGFRLVCGRCVSASSQRCLYSLCKEHGISLHLSFESIYVYKALSRYKRLFIGLDLGEVNGT